jgi:hypothetical protein
VETIRKTAQAFHAAGVKVYVKQMWLWRCEKCKAVYEDAALDLGGGCHCGARCSRVLATDPLLFPVDLRLRELPWALSTKGEP